MEIYNLYPGSYYSNCYVLISEDRDNNRHAAVVDPSAPAQQITEFLNSKNASLEMIIMTHGHFDHIMSLDDLRCETGAPAIIHESDAEMLGDGQKNAYSFFMRADFRQAEADRTVRNGDKLSLGEECIEIIHLPGHSKGSIALFCGNFMITGDTIFAEGFGRYDLYGGDAYTLKESLRSLKNYAPDLQIYAGHGESTSLSKALRAISYFTN